MPEFPPRSDLREILGVLFGHPGVFRYNRCNHGIVVAQTDGPDIVLRIPGGGSLAMSHAVGHTGGVVVVNFIDGVSHLGIAVAIFGQELIEVDLRLHVGMGGGKLDHLPG